MYNDTIKVANKIITETDIAEILQKIDEEIRENIQLCKQETMQNERLEWGYQHWTVKNFEPTFKCTFNFYDDTNITVDNYNAITTIYNTRLHEIKDMWVRCSYSYSIQEGKESDYIHQSINMYIYEDKMSIDVNLSSHDKKMDDIFQLIKNKVLGAPEKYDRIIKKKNSIMNKVGFARGFIPSLIICTLLVFIPQVREIYSMTYVLYPIAAIILGFMIGTTFFEGKLQRLYAPLVPKKKYAGYDSNKGKSVYKDDVDDYVTKSEIIIGKNIDNVKNRKEIADIEAKYKGYIPMELIMLLVLSIVIIVVGKIL